MKVLKAFTTIILCIITAFSALIPATATQERNDSYNFLLENGISSDALDSLDDETLDKITELILEKSDLKFINELDYLLSCGYPEELLKAVSDSALEHIASLIEDNEVSHVDYKTESSIGNSDVVLKRASAQLKNKETDKIAGELICIYWEWPEDKPLIRDEDYISVIWNKNFFCYKPDSFYAEDYWRESEEDAWTASDSYTRLAAGNLNSLGHWTDLESYKNHIGGVMIFKLTPTSPIEADSYYDDNLYINYSHQSQPTKTAILVILLFAIIFITVSIIVIKKRKRSK